MRKLNIVYDMDDVLNNLNSVVFGELNAPFPHLFNVLDCDELTKEQQREAIILFTSASTFRRLSLVDGANDIFQIEKTGKAVVWINTVSFDPEIIEVKKEMLRSIPGMDFSHAIFQLASKDGERLDGEDKDKHPEADIVIEDSINNLLRYDKDSTLRILINKPHNQAFNYGISDRDERIIRVDSLLEANGLIDKIVSGYNGDRQYVRNCILSLWIK